MSLFWYANSADFLPLDVYDTYQINIITKLFLFPTGELASGHKAWGYSSRWCRQQTWKIKLRLKKGGGVRTGERNKLQSCGIFYFKKRHLYVRWYINSQWYTQQWNRYSCHIEQKSYFSVTSANTLTWLSAIIMFDFSIFNKHRIALWHKIWPNITISLKCLKKIPYVMTNSISHDHFFFETLSASFPTCTGFTAYMNKNIIRILMLSMMILRTRRKLFDLQAFKYRFLLNRRTVCFIQK